MREKFTASDRPKETRKPGPLLDKPTLTRVKVQPEASVIATKKHTLEPLQPQNTVYRSPSKWLTVFLVITLCTCICWTLWLLMFNIAPNTMTNRIMRTEHLDEGSFWRFVDLNRTQLWLALIGLVTVIIGYVIVLCELIFTRARVTRLFHFVIRRCRLKALFGQGEIKSDDRVSTLDRFSSTLSSFSRDSSKRRSLKLAMKIGDLVVETIMLIQILESGAPVELVVTYTVIVISSVLACAIMMFISQTQAAITENLVDLIFDMLIVVGYPVLVIYYCLSLFTFDRAKFSINLEVFPPGWFESMASAIADPVEHAIIYKNLASLRITSFLMFFTRVGVNAALCVRLHDIVTLLQDPKKHRTSVYPKRQRLAVLGFVIYAVLLVIFVEESLRTSGAACRPHSECVVYARRWMTLEGNTQEKCPCLMLVDCNFAPTTYAEWLQPKDATKTVARLASMGLLQALKLTNRYLPEFPAELRDCTNLKYVSLIYTHTTTLPDWFHEFSKLEYLHVEGKYISSLQAIPEGLFDSMTSLTAIHFGWHPAVTQFPSLTTPNLKSLTLGGLISLQQIPRFEHLYQLERLVISALPLLDRFPDLSPVKNLLSFNTLDRGTWCCNGYLGKCDLENPMCMVHPIWGTPAAICLAKEDVASDTTLEIVSKFTSSICGPILRPTDLEPPLTEDMVAQCNGTLYRRCELPGFHEAMCFNLRFMVISCVHTPFAIEMRRRQIQERVGDPCNPEYEAWLGCTK